jgi:hypothetical protein
MNQRHNRTPTLDETVIYFPALECWNPMTGVATIAADINKKRICCRISIEVLQERFHASAENPMQSVKANRPVIEAAARKLIENRAYKEDGSIMIQRSDI